MRKAKLNAILYMNIPRIHRGKKNLSERVLFATGKNGKTPDYRIYRLNSREIISVLLVGIGCILSLAWLFYRKIWVAVIFSPLLIFLLKWEAERKKEARRHRLAIEFRDGMQALASALRAGYAVENAFLQAERELLRIYGKDSLLTPEFALIQRRLHMNETVESALADLAERSDLEDVWEMTQVFSIAKRSGGKLPEILQKTARTLEEKGRLEEEIRTLMAAKRLEQRMMCLMPAVILAYVGMTGSEFLIPLYQGTSGRVIMTVCLGLYGFAVWMGERIMKIEVL